MTTTTLRRVSASRTQPHFAKILFGENKTVIRGGIAVNYDFFFNNILANTAATVPNTFGVTNFGASLAARPIRAALLTSESDRCQRLGTPDPFATINTIPTDLVNPQTYVYNFGIQRELPFKLIGDVAYVGSRGTRLFINEQLNPGSVASIRSSGSLPIVARWSRARMVATRPTTPYKHDSIVVSAAGYCCGLLTRFESDR